jgi:hypothetical protein
LFVTVNNLYNLISQSIGTSMPLMTVLLKYTMGLKHQNGAAQTYSIPWWWAMLCRQTAGPPSGLRAVAGSMLQISCEKEAVLDY